MNSLGWLMLNETRGSWHYDESAHQVVWKGRNGWHQDVREMTKNEMLSVGLIIISPQLGFDENDVI